MRPAPSCPERRIGLPDDHKAVPDFLARVTAR
jgi:hypothetical protein